jgi:hypothetical protein
VETVRDTIEHDTLTRFTFRCSPYDQHSALHTCPPRARTPIQR